jgi:hypothetical protein
MIGHCLPAQRQTGQKGICQWLVVGHWLGQTKGLKNQEGHTAWDNCTVDYNGVTVNLHKE